jgi:hypothetical protein
VTRRTGEDRGPRSRGVLLYRWASLGAVQNHVQNILSKLQLKKRYELMRYALQRGLDRTPD